MKRSQMVERIYDLLNCDGVLEYSMPSYEPVPLTEEHVRWIAEQILQEVEKAGMLPPIDAYIRDSNPEFYEDWESEDV